MKPIIQQLYGKELGWFRTLSTGQKYAVVYMLLSFTALLLAASSDSAAAVLLCAANTAVAARACRRVPFDTLDD